MNIIEVKTADLIGSALDWAVAKADGLPLSEEACQDDFILIGTGCGDLERFSPSTDWSQGGPLIEKYRMHFLKAADGYAAYYLPDSVRPAFYRNGGTHLIAACRAIVAAKLGDVVQIPSELLP